MVRLNSDGLTAEGKEIERLLVDKGIFKDLDDYQTNVEDGRITYAEGYPMTAIEKFLGYYDDKTNIAYSPSISFNTDLSVAQAYCEYSKVEGKDSVLLDGTSDERYTAGAGKALDNFRRMFNVKGSFRFNIKRVKRYGSAKGLGESAAVAAATARALVGNVFGEEAAKDDIFVSRIARYASGSGTRSVTGGFSIWLSYPGISERACHGANLPVKLDRFSFIAYPNPSQIKTFDAHRVVVGSPFYETWIRNKYKKIINLIDSGFALDEMMRHAEEDMLLLNSMMTSQGIFIQGQESLKIINAVVGFKAKGNNIYMTADTGPSIVVMSEDKSLLDEFKKSINAESLGGRVTKRPIMKLSGLGNSDIQNFVGK